MPVYLLVVEGIHEFISDSLEGIYENFINLRKFRKYIVDFDTAKKRMEKTNGEYCPLDNFEEEDSWNPFEGHTYEVYKVKSDLA